MTRSYDLIAMEFAHVAKRAGASEVTVLEMMDRPLGPFDPDLVAMRVEATEEPGVDLRTKAKVAKIEKRGDDFRLSQLRLRHRFDGVIQNY